MNLYELLCIKAGFWQLCKNTSRMIYRRMRHLDTVHVDEFVCEVECEKNDVWTAEEQKVSKTRCNSVI